jgi:hypothetical protein
LLTAYVLIDTDQAFGKAIEELLDLIGLNVATSLSDTACSDAYVWVEKYVVSMTNLVKVFSAVFESDLMSDDLAWAYP